MRSRPKFRRIEVCSKVLKVGDKVEIISSVHSELIGRKAVITNAVKPLVDEPYYRLDIIAGYWTDEKLKKI